MPIANFKKPIKKEDSGENNYSNYNKSKEFLVTEE